MKISQQDERYSTNPARNSRFPGDFKQATQDQAPQKYAHNTATIAWYYWVGMVMYQLRNLVRITVSF